MTKTRHVGYGIYTFEENPNPPLDEAGKPVRDPHVEDSKLAVKILDLLCREKNGKLQSEHAISALQKTIGVIHRNRTRISQEAPLPSIFVRDLHIGSDHQSDN